MNSESNPHETVSQLSLFGAPILPDDTRVSVRKTSIPSSVGQQHLVSPYLLAARRLSRQIRRLPDHSPQGTATGLAICRALKAYLEDQADRTH